MSGGHQLEESLGQAKGENNLEWLKQESLEKARDEKNLEWGEPKSAQPRGGKSEAQPRQSQLDGAQRPSNANSALSNQRPSNSAVDGEARRVSGASSARSGSQSAASKAPERRLSEYENPNRQRASGTSSFVAQEPKKKKKPKSGGNTFADGLQDMVLQQMHDADGPDADDAGVDKGVERR